MARPRFWGKRNSTSRAARGDVSARKLFNSLDAKHHEYRVEKLRRSLSTAYREGWSPLRKRIVAVLETTACEAFIGLLLVVNLIVVIKESDHAVICQADADVECALPIIAAINHTLLLVYTAESLVRLFVYRSDFVFHAWNVFDAVVVFVSLAEIMLRSLAPDSALPNMQYFRIFRAMRLMRTVRIFEIFPELYYMVRGFASAMAAMWWGFVLIALTILLWSIVAVEILHPLNAGLDHGDDGRYCELAFSSTMRASLFFFQTLVAGDEWSACAIPLIEKQPAVSVLFVGALVCVQLGFTNLVLSVIVDVASNSRDMDRALKESMERERQKHARDMLQAQFNNMDRDRTRTVSLEELQVAYHDNAEFQQLLEIVHLDEGDLHEVFELMDTDNSGSVDIAEFGEFVTKMQGEDPRVQMLLLRTAFHAMLAKMQTLHEILLKVLNPTSMGTGCAPTAAGSPRPSGLGPNTQAKPCEGPSGSTEHQEPSSNTTAEGQASKAGVDEPAVGSARKSRRNSNSMTWLPVMDDHPLVYRMAASEQVMANIAEVQAQLEERVSATSCAEQTFLTHAARLDEIVAILQQQTLQGGMDGSRDPALDQASEFPRTPEEQAAARRESHTLEVGVPILRSSGDTGGLLATELPETACNKCSM